MAAGEANPPHKYDPLSAGPASFSVPTQSNQNSKSVELPSTYSSIVQRQPHCQTATTKLHNVWLEDDTKLLKPFSCINGEPTFILSDTEKNNLVQKIEYVLIGKFSHGRPTMATIKVFFANLHLQDECNLCSFDSKHIYIECKNKSDFYKIWMKLNWNISGYSMRVFKWESHFSPERESSIAPVWIRIEDIPLYLFDKLSLSSFSSAIGKPICIDQRNVNHSLLKCALICVELDVAKPLVNSIWIDFKEEVQGVSSGGLRIKVCYDVVPNFCTFCCHLGHSPARCKQIPKSSDVDRVAKPIVSKTVLPLNMVGSKPGLQPFLFNSNGKDVVASVNGGSSVISNVWQPVNKKQCSTSKDKAVLDHSLDVAVKNKFNLLHKAGNLALSLQNPSNAVLDIAGSTLNIGAQVTLADLSQAEKVKEPMDLQKDKAVRVATDAGSEAKRQSEIYSKGAAEQKKQANGIDLIQTPARASNLQYAKDPKFNAPVLADKAVQQQRMATSGHPVMVYSNPDKLKIRPLAKLTPFQAYTPLRSMENKVGTSYVEASEAAATLHSWADNVCDKGTVIKETAMSQAMHNKADEKQANKLGAQVASVASSSYAVQHSEINVTVITSQAFLGSQPNQSVLPDASKKITVKTAHHLEHTARAVHEVTKKQVQEPDIKADTSDQVGYQKGNASGAIEQAVVDFATMTTAQIRAYTHQQCQEMEREMFSDAGLLFSSTTAELTSAAQARIDIKRYLEMENDDVSQYEEMDDDEVLQYEEELHLLYCDEMEKKQKKKNCIYASPPTFRVGSLR